MANQQSFSESVQAAASRGERLLLPLVDSLLPRVASMTQQALLSDPVQWGRAIMQTTDLVGGDAIAISVDPDMTLIGCGATLCWEGDSKYCKTPITLSDALNTADLSQYLQMLEGLVQSPLRNKPCAVTMLGPATVVTRIFDEAPGKARFNEVKAHLTALAEAICQLRPEMLIFIEDETALNQTPLNDLRRIYNTLGNVSSYYGVDKALLTHSITPDQAQSLTKLRLDALLLTGLGESNVPELLDAAADWPLLGLPLPVHEPQAVRTLQAQLDSDAASAGRLFYLTPGQLPHDCDLEQLRDVKRELGAGAS